MNDKVINNEIVQSEINNILWRACDSFRGTLDAADYKDYILVMLFLKYISDVWQDHYEEYKKKYNNEEQIRRKLKRERFVLPFAYVKEIDKHGKETIIESFLADFYSLYERRDASNLGELINITLEAIEIENKEKLNNVFRNIDFNSEARLGNTIKRNHILQHLMDDFNDPRLDLRPSRIGNLDVIGNAYEFLIGKFAAGAGKKAGEFYTPPEVSILIAKLLQPQAGDRICDPACGSGSLLLKCANQVGSNNYSIFGQEAISSTWALCMMNMFLHEVNNPRIEWADTLIDPKLLEDDKLMKFDVVVANPPFSLDKWGANQSDIEMKTYNRWHRGVPPKSKGDYAFISHMIETTTETSGRVGVVVPHGVLFRGGNEGKIRKALIEENLLDAVIGLPQNLFFGTGIPAAILIFRRDRNRITDVLFIDASREFDQEKTQNKIREAVEVQKIVETYRVRQSVDKYAYLANWQEIKDNEYNLNIARYVDTFVEQGDIDIRGMQNSITTLEDEIARLRHKINEALTEIGL